MSTLSSAKETQRVAPPDGATIGDAVGDFVSTFQRWVRTLVGPDAPSYPRMRLLCELHDAGQQRMADLAAALDVTPRNVTVLVDGLERDGVVRRRPHPTDRRVTLIELSASAHDAVQRSIEHQAAIAALFESLPPADRSTLLRLLGDLGDQMRSTWSTPVPAEASEEAPRDR